MGSMSSLRWTQSCQLLENPLSSGTLSFLSVGTRNSFYNEMCMFRSVVFSLVPASKVNKKAFALVCSFSEDWALVCSRERRGLS